MAPEELLQKIGVRQLPPPSLKPSKAGRAQADRGHGKAGNDKLHDRTPDDFQAGVGIPPEGYELKWHGEADDTPLKEWLVDKTLPKKGKAVLAGQWGTYKTFVALDLCCSVMTRSVFAGHAVHRQGGVLFIAAEGQDEVRVRLEGIAREKVAKATPGDTRNEAEPVDPTRMPFAWAEACPRLTADDALAKLRAMVSAAARGMRERFGLPLALIVIDTLMPAAGFKDANDASENQRVMDVLTNVAMEADALLLVVDHFGKDVTTGTRNSSVKEAAVDAYSPIGTSRAT
jgi:RecA-family ATPase